MISATEMVEGLGPNTLRENLERFKQSGAF